MLSAGLSLAVATAGGSAAAADPASPPRAARWAKPDEAPIYIELGRAAPLLDQLSNERVIGSLRAVPGLDKVFESPHLRQAHEVASQLATALGTTPHKLLSDLLGGRVELVVAGKDKLVLVLEPGNLETLQRGHTKLLEMARNDASSKGKPDPVQQFEHQGVTVFSVSPTEAHAILDGALVIASSPELLKQVVDRAEAPPEAADSLAGSDLWRKRREAAGEATAWGLVRLDLLRKIDPKTYATDKKDAGATLLFGPWLASVRTSDWAAIDITWNGDRLAASLELPNPSGGNSPEFQGYLPGPKDHAAAPLEPPGTVASISLWRDFAAIWEARGELFPPEAQQGFAQLDTFAGTFFGGRDFGSGVLGSLSHEWRLVITHPDPESLDPRPDVLLPAFALVVGLIPEDEDFVLRLKSAFQSFIGLANLGAAQEKAPPLMLGSEQFEGESISTARYLPPRDRPADEPVDQRFNFSPSAVQVGDHFVISSSLTLARDLVKVLKAPPETLTDARPATLLVSASGAQFGRLIESNRERLIADNMLKKGSDRAQAETEIGFLQTLAQTLVQGQLTVVDGESGHRFQLEFRLARPE